jgi:hypothetical protein
VGAIGEPSGTAGSTTLSTLEALPDENDSSVA